MKTYTDFSLRNFNTFGIDSMASRVVMPESEDDFRETSKTVRQPFFILGGGSNVVLPDRYEGTVIHPENRGVRLVDSKDCCLLVEAAAGEVWADFVDHCISQGWYGLENLAGIPGNVGAAPVQNVGAYGSEAKDVIDAVHCFEIGSGEEHWFSSDDCQFAYRWSRFKGEWKDRYLIDRVRFRLDKTFVPNLSYKAIASLVDTARGISASQLASIVVSIRDSKLPNPMQIGSAGSFFKNPIVDNDTYQHLKTKYSDIVAFPIDGGGYKLAAGWLIEQCGWKGRSCGNVGVYEKQALVLVNLGNAKCCDIKILADRIRSDVFRKFGVEISPEAIFV